MRASSLVLGPLVARAGRARVSFPGGCAIGARPIDLHLSGLQRLGAEISQEHGYIEAPAPEGLRGAHIVFDRITVTGTEDILMAAVLADGETVIENAAREPEVRISRRSSSGWALKSKAPAPAAFSSRASRNSTALPTDHRRPHRGRYLVLAGAITGGDILVTGCIAEHLGALIEKLPQAGVDVAVVDPSTIRVHAGSALRAVDMTTEEYPGFATDLQAQFMALMTQANGISIVTETIFENRFMHAQELMRMGANIRIDGRTAIIAGRSRLTGAGVIASDLRASASLVLAALVARRDRNRPRLPY